MPRNLRARSTQPSGALPHQRGSASFTTPDSAIVTSTRPDEYGLFLVEPFGYTYRPGLRKWYKRAVNRRLRYSARDDIRSLELPSITSAQGEMP